MPRIRHEIPLDYSCPVVSGERVFVMGTTRFDYPTNVIFDKPAEQKLHTFCNIDAAQFEADPTLSNAVRTPYVAINLEQLEIIAELVSKNSHKIRPFTKTIIFNYVDQRMKNKIESTAQKQREAGRCPPFS